MEDIKQKFEELLEICEKHTGDMYQVFQKRPFSAAKYGTGDLRFLADK